VFGLASWWAAKRSYSKKRTGVLRYASNTPNSIFIGFPVILALFDKQFFIFAVLLGTLVDAILNSIRISVLQKASASRSHKTKLHLKTFLNPISFSLFAGIAVVLLGVELPSVMREILGWLGKTSSYVALLVMGASLYGMNLRRNDRTIIREISFFKLMLMPAVILMMGWLGGLSAEQLQISVVIGALPAAVFTLIVSENLKLDAHLAADSILITTLLAPLSVAGWWWLLSLLG
jgi:predicted permease